MARHKPPTPANDHTPPKTAPGEDVADHELSDAELEARLAAVAAARRRALKLAILRMGETSLADLNAKLGLGDA